MSQRRSDWFVGFVAGTAFGLAVAMIFLDPGLITPENIRLRGIVGGTGIAVATIIQFVFERRVRKSEARP
jgi:hypothetical protein